MFVSNSILIIAVPPSPSLIHVYASMALSPYELCDPPGG